MATGKVIDLRKRRVERLAVELARELVSTTYLIVEVDEVDSVASGGPSLGLLLGSAGGRCGPESASPASRSTPFGSTTRRSNGDGAACSRPALVRVEEVPLHFEALSFVWRRDERCCDLIRHRDE